MLSSFPFSMENIPRQRSFACLSLKFGSIVSALLIILYSVLVLAQCIAALGQLLEKHNSNDIVPWTVISLVVTVTTAHALTLFFSAIMLVGVLREKLQLIRPWIVWTSIQMIVVVLLFVYWTTMSFVSHSGGDSLAIYIVEFLSLLIRFYMLMIVASYYKQLEEERYEGERAKTLIQNNNKNWYNSA